MAPGGLKRCALRIAAAAVAGGAAALILAGAPTLAGPVATGGVSKPAQRPEKPEQVLDHFLCYQVADHFPPAGLPAIALMDQFDRWLDDLLIDDSLCNPVDKHPAEGPDAHRKNNAAHLVCYLIWPPEDITDPVLINNQFTRFPNSPNLLTLSKEYSLCVPSTKAPAPRNPGGFANLDLDHFKCYLVTPTLPVPFPPPATQVTLKDQFIGPAQLAVSLVPELLCVPADKMLPGKPPTRRRHPAAHLACYPIIFPPAAAIPKVRVRSQLEPNPGPVLQPLRPWVLCLPSSKRLLSTDQSKRRFEQ
jgi:hypothetical protein